ncbi:MAG: universal stress protein [Burkholderiales bacterium]|nr:universal stress protein [Burkholderiales bacterium]
MTHPFRRPLLATEHSVYDGGAETLALALARAWGLHLHAVLPMLSNPEFQAVAPQVAARADAAAAERRESLEAMARAQDVELSVRVREGPAIHEIFVRAAREIEADLIVVRRRGRKGLLANMLVGDMVGKLVASAPCSVLIVPRAARLWLRGVLLVVEAGGPPDAVARGAAMHAARLAAAIATRCALPLWLVAALTTDAGDAQAQQMLDALSAPLTAGGAAVRSLVARGALHEVALRAAAEQGCDLLVLARDAPDAQGRSRGWSSGRAQKAIGAVECPVLLAVRSPT